MPLEHNPHPLIFDLGCFKIMEHCSPEILRQEEEYVRREFTTLLRNSASPRQSSDHMQLCLYLEKCHDLVEARLKQSASYYSKLQWLWYLRRLPHTVFEGHLSTTLTYDSGLAETLSAIAGRQEESTQRIGRNFTTM